LAGVGGVERDVDDVRAVGRRGIVGDGLVDRGGCDHLFLGRGKLRQAGELAKADGVLAELGRQDDADEEDGGDRGGPADDERQTLAVGGVISAAIRRLL
jgi:hypothetical protein